MGGKIDIFAPPNPWTGLPLKLRVIGGVLLFVTYSALVFDVLSHLTFAHGLSDDFSDAMRSMSVPLGVCTVVPFVCLGLLLLAGAFSAVVGRRWGLCLLACVCAMAAVLVTFYLTAIIGTAALLFIVLSKEEFLDLQKNPLPPPV
jgi:hypothetical protein